MIKKKAKSNFLIDPQKKVLTLFPGSRYQEIEKLTSVFLQTANQIKKIDKSVQIFLSLSHEDYRKYIENQITKTKAEVKLVIGVARELLEASDFLLSASGTATLQSAFHYLPTAIAYRISPLTTLLGKIFVKGKFFGMPNILANGEIYREFLNDDCNPKVLADHIDSILFNEDNYQKMVKKSKELIDKIRIEDHPVLLGKSIHNLMTSE